MFNWTNINNCFKGILVKTCERKDGARMGLSRRCNAVLSCGLVTNHNGAEGLKSLQVQENWSLLTEGCRMHRSVTSFWQIPFFVFYAVTRWAKVHTVYLLLRGLLCSYLPYIKKNTTNLWPTSSHFTTEWLQMFQFSHNSVTLNEGHGHSCWYQNVEFSYVCCRTKFECKPVLNIFFIILCKYDSAPWIWMMQKKLKI